MTDKTAQPKVNLYEGNNGTQLDVYVSSKNTCKQHEKVCFLFI